MPRTTPTHYLWLGKNPRGQWTRGHHPALSRQALALELRRERIRLCWAVRWSAKWHITSSWLAVLQTQRKVRSEDITRLSRQLATLLQAGLPLLQSLRLMTHGVQTHPLGLLLTQLATHIEAGRTLSDAMRQATVFDATYCHLIAAGESSGQLDLILARLATHREKSDALQKRLRSALMYPGIVMGIGTIVSALLLSFVVPTFEQIFSSMGAQLPPLTQAILHLSRILAEHGLVLALMVCGSLLGLRHLIQKTTRGQRVWDVLRLRIPLWKDLTQRSQCARWCRTLSTLLYAGIPIHEALWQLIHVLDHGSYRLATQTMQTQITQGHPLTHGLSAHPQLFEPVLMQMCAVGEESGTLDEMLARMADHYELAVDTLCERMSTLLEPTIMVVLGLTIGTLVLAMYWPIFEIGQVL